jgi:hypothetical protein
MRSSVVAHPRRTLVKVQNWNKPKLLAWLGDNPIKNTVDVVFLMKEEASFRNVLFEAKKETAQLTINNNPYDRLFLYTLAQVHETRSHHLAFSLV